jgi:peptide/nickel transport system permease protein
MVNAIPAKKDAGNAVYVAPAWKLTWWRFRKHKLAVFSLWVVVLISAIAAMPEFFAVQDPT